MVLAEPISGWSGLDSDGPVSHPTVQISNPIIHVHVFGCRRMLTPQIVCARSVWIHFDPACALGRVSTSRTERLAQYQSVCAWHVLRRLKV